MAQDPVAENAVRLARAFRISHGISEWPELSEEPTLHNWLFCNLPACANLACVAGLDPATPAAVYHLRGSDSHLSRPPLPPLSDLFDDLFRSFLHFLRASTCYIAVTIQNITKASF